MTEAEWLTCAEPDRMLWLPLIRNKISDRKLRLFACACCRRMWNLLTDERSRNVVEVAEKYADGLATQEELEAAREMARQAETSPVITGSTPLGPAVHYTPGSVASSAAAIGTRFSPRPTAIFMAIFAEKIAGDRAAYAAERKEQAAIFRDLIGNPFRPSAIAPASLDWNGGTVGKIALAIYHNREFDHLGIVADALEEAGCTDANILAHCRGPGSHVRSCWALDLVLVKN
jgi:hypothetical protein